MHAAMDFSFLTMYLPPLGWKDSPWKLPVMTAPISSFLLGRATSKQVNTWLQSFLFFSSSHSAPNRVNQWLHCAKCSYTKNVPTVACSQWTTELPCLVTLFASVPVAVGLLRSLFKISLNKTPSIHLDYLSVSQSLLKRKRSPLLIVHCKRRLAAGEYCDIDCVGHTGAYTKITVGIIVLALTSGRICKNLDIMEWRGDRKHHLRSPNTPDQWPTHSSK